MKSEASRNKMLANQMAAAQGRRIGKVEHRTPPSEQNVQIEADRPAPTGGPVGGPPLLPRFGSYFLTQKDLSEIRHNRAVKNSIQKRMSRSNP